MFFSPHFWRYNSCHRRRPLSNISPNALSPPIAIPRISINFHGEENNDEVFDISSSNKENFYIQSASFKSTFCLALTFSEIKGFLKSYYNDFNGSSTAVQTRIVIDSSAVPIFVQLLVWTQFARCYLYKLHITKAMLQWIGIALQMTAQVSLIVSKTNWEFKLNLREKNSWILQRKMSI